MSKKTAPGDLNLADFTSGIRVDAAKPADNRVDKVERSEHPTSVKGVAPIIREDMC